MSATPTNPYSFFGVTTFCKAPQGVADRDGFADVAVLGVPFDLGTGYRSGTRFGPKAIRDISVRYRLSGDEPGYWDLRTESRKAACRIVDCGDVEVLPLDWEKCFENITNGVRTIVEHNAMPVVLGGDHSITLPVLRAYEGRGPLTILHFDAHTDYRDDVMGVRYGHGNVMRRASELDWVERIVSCGIRSLRTQQEDVEANRRDANVIIPAWDIHQGGVAAVADQLPSDADVYISFDIDAMDPGIAPGTGTPEVGGLQYEEAREILEVTCPRNRIVGMDLVEVNPNYDAGQITALLAAQLIVETLGFVFPG